VILADGSTTGLQQPKQYVGKNGPTDKPDSILLEHNGTHTSVSQKCSTYSNWMQIVKKRHCKTFSNQEGDCSSIQCSNWAITTTKSDLSDDPAEKSQSLVFDQQGNPVPEATIDTLTAAIINSVFSNGSNQLNVFAQATDEFNKGFIASLQRMLARIAGTQNPEQAPALREMNIKVIETTADNPAQTRSGSRLDTLQVRSAATAIIGTMQSHGYDVKQAASM